MFLVAGLGNPGTEYDNTRHNVGFSVIDELATRNRATIKEDKKFVAGWFQFLLDDEKTFGAKPHTFMNDSGLAVSKLMRFFKIPTANLIVAYDDLDLEQAQIRVRRGGSSGGHLGLTSIINSMGTQDFYRVRIGIGRPPGRMDPAAYVLQRLKKKELESISFAVNDAADAVEEIIQSGLEKAMNKYN